MNGVHAVTKQAITRAVSSGLEPLKAVTPQRLSEWAAAEFKLSSEGSHTTGNWEAYPFQIGWMDAFSNDDIEEVDVRKSKRVGYTKTLLAFMAYNAAHRRRKQALWQPTDDDRDSFVKSEVEPMLRDVAAVKAVHRSGVEDTMKLKSFLGSVLHILGGKAARAYRRITVAVSMLDELDGFDLQIEKSADPITLARGRLEGAPFPKLVCGTTPRIKGTSHIEHRESQANAVMRFHVACPHCDVEHPLMFGTEKTRHGFRWDSGDPSSVRHVCPHCFGEIRQADYLRVWGSGAWVDIDGRYRYGMDGTWRDARGEQCKAPRHVAFHIWAAYSPQRSWEDIVREFLEANVKAKAGDIGPLQGFFNETLGETWEVRAESSDEHDLMQRPHRYEVRTAPEGCLVLAAGVDVQDNRFEVVVWGFGQGEEMFAIDYQVITANPADERDWAKLDSYLETTFPKVGWNHSIGIEAIAIDTGGHFTHHVYNFVRQRSKRRYFAVKGSSLDGRPIKGKSSLQDVNWRGQVIKRGVKLWDVGTDTAKDLLHGRLMVREPGPGYVHFPSGLPAEFYHQLTAEGRVYQRTANGGTYRWVKRRPNGRNETLDCTVYSLFCAQQLDLHRYTQAMWDRLRIAVEPEREIEPEPVQQVEQVAALPPPEEVKAARRRRGRFSIGPAWGR